VPPSRNNDIFCKNIPPQRKIIKHLRLNPPLNAEHISHLIMAKLSSLLKYEAPGMAVTVCFPALIKSGSTWRRGLTD
jgi:hypothetical protein